MNLHERLETLRGKRAIIIGKPTSFTREELARYLKKEADITLEDTLTPETAIAFEAPKLNPVEEMQSEEAYEAGVTLLKLAELEKAVAKSLKPDAVLMSIKLTNDQARIYRLLGNAHIEDALFLRLLKAYEWGEIDDDLREDRDVVTYTLRRFLKVRPTEEDLLTTYLSLRRLATQTDNAELLDALAYFPDYDFSVRGKARVSLYETVAANPHIAQNTVERLLALRRGEIYRALAGNASVSHEIRRRLFGLDDAEVDKALAHNRAIDDALFEALLQRGNEETAALLAVRQPIDTARYEMLRRYVTDSALLALTGANESIDTALADKLSREGDEATARHLAQNPTVTTAQLKRLYDRFGDRLREAMAVNPHTPAELLETWFAQSDKRDALAAALAQNPALDAAKLDELYAKGDYEVHKALATNPSCTDMLLDQLKLDSRLQPYLAQNEKLIRSYEAVLNQQKVMMNV